MNAELHDRFAASDQSDVARTTDLLLKDLVASGLRARLDGGAWDAEAWSALEAIGLPMALCREQDGGGFGWIDVLPALQALGGHQVALPLCDTMIGNMLLSGNGRRPPGGVLALCDVQDSDAALLEGKYGDYTLSGHFRNVPWARHATEALLSMPVDGRRLLCAVPLHDSVTSTLHHATNTAGEPRDHITLQSATLSWWVDIGPESDPCPVRCFGALGRCAMMVGACESALGQTITHCKDRVQFGQPLGRFQVVQHAVAVMATHVSAAATAVAAAFAAAEIQADPAIKGTLRFDIATAKCTTDEAAAQCRTSAHQLHGAMGFTFEHPLHYATRRLWAWRREFGDANGWAAELGAAAVANGSEDFWPWLVARGERE